MTTTNQETLLAEYDEERPGRRLSGGVDIGFAVVCALLSLFVLYNVFRPVPQGGQYYTTIFLAVVLPLVFCGYRSGFRLSLLKREAHNTETLSKNPSRRSLPARNAATTLESSTTCWPHCRS